MAEALFLAERLREARMSADGLVVNRTHLDGLGGHAPDEVAALLGDELGAPAGASALAGNLADFDVLARRDRDVDRAAVLRARRHGPGGRAPAR